MPNNNNNKKDIAKPASVFIEKAPLLSPLLAKFKSEVNTISKYFKEINTKSNLAKPTKSYAQASKQPTSTSDVLKIKEFFPALNANQINRVNNIVKGNPKPKPHIQMTMLQIIDQYVKKSEDINKLQVEEPHLPQSKSYLKITGILYFPNSRTQEHLSASDIETVLKQNQIFDNIKLASKPRVIKISPKSDMSIVWLDIWDY